MFPPKKQIFRQNSLDRLASPEQLDQLIQVVEPMDWLPMATISGLLLLGVAWSIWGRIPMTVSGKGMLLLPDQVIRFQSPVSGQLETLNVQEGSCVEKGAVLATIQPTSLNEQLQLQQDKLTQLETQSLESDTLLQQRTERERIAIASSRQSLQQQLQDTQSLTLRSFNTNITAINEQRYSLQTNLQHSQTISSQLKKKLEDAKLLVEQGVLAQVNLLQYEQEYLESLQQISDLEYQLKQVDANQTEIERNRHQDISSLNDIRTQLSELETRDTELTQQVVESTNQRQNQIAEVRREIAQLSGRIEENSQIISPHSGCVLEVAAASGQVVNAGTRLGTLNMGTETDQMKGIIYFALKDGKQLKPGMEVQITPDTVKRERFGGILGTVESVSAFPVTMQGAVATIGNEAVAESLISADQPAIEVVTALNLNPETFSGYDWSSSAGPALKLTAGTTANARASVEERAPITFVLPILREWTGLK